MLSMAVTQSLCDEFNRLYTSGFKDDIMGLVGQNKRRRYVWSSLPCVGTGSEVCYTRVPCWFAA